MVCKVIMISCSKSLHCLSKLIIFVLMFQSTPSLLVMKKINVTFNFLNFVVVVVLHIKSEVQLNTKKKKGKNYDQLKNS